MLFFYALLFFLFGSSVVAVSNPFAGYWVLKELDSENKQLAGKVLQIGTKGEYYFLELDKNFKTDSKKLVEPHEMSSLVDTVWQPIPTDVNGDGIRFLDLVFRMTDPERNKISPDLVETQASRFTTLPGNSDCSNSLSTINDKRADGYWVIGDAPMNAVSAASWRKILRVKKKRFTTFKLDKEFKIIPSSSEEVKMPSPGDYFPIPFIGMESRWHRLLMLKVRQTPDSRFAIGVKHPSD
ncbi:hypothetical protein F5887DRAFT_290302 [Amanita rubescens]|nr:hypothetical protein F5887DRAFT_290302 [Amanita rubescens]